MFPFEYLTTKQSAEAINAVASAPAAAYLAGGTSQIDLMKEGVLRPALLVDVTDLPYTQIQELPDGGIRIGAGVSNTAAAEFPAIRERYPVISEAIMAGASTQIRNMATVGGNPLQRTRCPYYRDTSQPCNKREPGSGCAAVDGINRNHAIFGFGADPTCVATHPSDFAVALAAVDAVVQCVGPDGERSIPFADLHRLPGDEPQRETTLQHGELITSIDLPPAGGASHYLKARDRASYAFALVSCAVHLELEDQVINRAKIALGGVAHKPWRASRAEEMLSGKPASQELFREAARTAFEAATPLRHNEYKVTLGSSLMVRALMETAGLSPLQGPAGTVFAASAGGVAG